MSNLLQNCWHFTNDNQNNNLTPFKGPSYRGSGVKTANLFNWGPQWGLRQNKSLQLHCHHFESVMKGHKTRFWALIFWWCLVFRTFHSMRNINHTDNSVSNWTITTNCTHTDLEPTFLFQCHADLDRQVFPLHRANQLPSSPSTHCQYCEHRQRVPIVPL